jgi:hypothetical protein
MVEAFRAAKEFTVLGQPCTDRVWNRNEREQAGSSLQVGGNSSDFFLFTIPLYAVTFQVVAEWLARRSHAVSLNVGRVEVSFNM